MLDTDDMYNTNRYIDAYGIKDLYGKHISIYRETFIIVDKDNIPVINSYDGKGITQYRFSLTEANCGRCLENERCRINNYISIHCTHMFKNGFLAHSHTEKLDMGYMLFGDHYTEDQWNASLLTLKVKLKTLLKK